MRLDHLLSKELNVLSYTNCVSILIVYFSMCFKSTFLYIRLILVINHNLLWGCSSVGRASALQAGGQEFDSPHLHQSIHFMDAILNENAKHFHFLSPLTETNRG